MPVTFASEAWPACLAELQEHWPAHYDEVSALKGVAELAPDYDEYARLWSTGALHLITARDKGALVGYATAIVRRHLHYRQTLCAYYDLYYVAPTHRRTGAGLASTGLRLIRELKASLDRRGVQVHFSGTKKTKDAGILFKRLGWRENEALFIFINGNI